MTECESCGAQLDEEDEYCRACGNRVTPDREETPKKEHTTQGGKHLSWQEVQMTPYPTRAREEKTVTKRDSRLGLVTLAVLAAIVFGICQLTGEGGEEADTINTFAELSTEDQKTVRFGLQMCDTRTNEGGYQIEQECFSSYTESVPHEAAKEDAVSRAMTEGLSFVYPDGE